MRKYNCDTQFTKLSVDGFDRKVHQGSIETLRISAIKPTLVELYLNSTEPKEVIEPLQSRGLTYSEDELASPLTKEEDVRDAASSFLIALKQKWVILEYRKPEPRITSLMKPT